MSSIGNSGARSSGPTGCSVPGCSCGGGGAGRSGITLYQALGICDSSRVDLVRSDTRASARERSWVVLPQITPVTWCAIAASRLWYMPAMSAAVPGVMPVVPEVSPAVRSALQGGRPVVALESTIISHGLPRPANLAAALSFEALLLETGVTPATIALIDGVPRAGLSGAELERIALDESVIQVSSRDLGPAMVSKVTGGTTVAATSVLAFLAGIRVFATGGLGGVHRDFADSFDESADLTVLGRTPITVVAAGVKSILNIPATLERLETLGVAVVGYRTDRFP